MRKMKQSPTVKIYRELDDGSEIEIEVEYDYFPAEEAVLYYSDGAGYPGCPASVDICEAKRTDTGSVVYLSEDEEEKVIQLAHDIAMSSPRGKLRRGEHYDDV